MLLDFFCFKNRHFWAGANLLQITLYLFLFVVLSPILKLNILRCKGATATEYGLVFGIFELTVFLVSPVVGRFLPWVGATRAFCLGIFITGSMCVLFGLLNYIQVTSANHSKSLTRVLGDDRVQGGSNSIKKLKVIYKLGNLCI